MRCYVAWLIGVLFWHADAAAQPADLVAHWPRGARSLLASSIDPSGGNNDRGNYVRVAGDTAVLMEAKGSGVITRLWSANPAGTLRIYLDDESTPRYELPFAELTSRAAPPALRAHCNEAGGGVCLRTNLPFARFARVEAQGTSQLYYQVNYTTVPIGANVGQQWSPLPVPSGRSAPVSVGPSTLAPRSSKTVRALPGSGTITDLRVTISPDTLALRRAVRLRLTWDGAVAPSVDVPLADLENMTLDWPMPYRAGATIALANTGPTPTAASVSYQANGPASGAAAYFCATGQASKTVAGRPHILLAVNQPGLYVGTLARLVGAGDTKYLEGDEVFVVDGRDTLAGTGTEDFFDGAWFFRFGPYAQPDAGAPWLVDGKMYTRAYRYQRSDAIGFERSMKATLEHGAKNDAPGSVYRTVALWYSPTPVASSPMAPEEPRPGFTEKSKDLLIVEGESLASDIGDLGSAVDDTQLPYQASGAKALRIVARSAAALPIKVPVPRAGPWEIGLHGSPMQADPAAGSNSESLGVIAVMGRELSVDVPLGRFAQGPVSIDYFWLREVAKAREAVEAETLPLNVRDGQAKAVQHLSGPAVRSPLLIGGAVPVEALFSGGSALRFDPRKVGEVCQLAIEVPEDQEYGLAAAWAREPGAGVVSLELDGRALATVYPHAEQADIGTRWGLGIVPLTAGKHTLRLEAKQIGPVNLDYLLLQPAARGQEAEWLAAEVGTAARLTVKERFGAEPRWSGGAYVAVKCTAGQSATFAVQAPRAGRYTVALTPAKVPGGVASQATLNGQPIGAIDSAGTGEALGQAVSAVVKLRKGANDLVLASDQAGLVTLDVVTLEYQGQLLGSWLAMMVGLLVALLVLTIGWRAMRRAS